MSSLREIIISNTLQLCSILRDRVYSISEESLAIIMADKNIMGEDFLDFTDTELKELIPTMGERKQQRKLICSVKPLREVNIEVSLDEFVMTFNSVCSHAITVNSILILGNTRASQFLFGETYRGESYMYIHAIYMPMSYVIYCM